MTKVSVIVPVYNVYDYLTKCLESLVNQTLDDIEILVINDGSPDDSQNIIDIYSKKYPNKVKAFIKENGGLSDARNYGLQRASGEFISFVDSDDYLKRDTLEKMYNYALDNNLDLVVCDTINVYSNNHEKLIKSNLHYSDNDICNYLISPPMACTRLYKREIFDDLKFKKGILYEDLYLTPSLVLKTKKIGFLEEGLYYYLQRDGSIMKQKEFNPKLLDIFYVLDYNYKNLKDEYFAEIEYMYITHLLRTATLRFLNYADTQKYLEKIVETIKLRFPHWRKNKYLKKSSFKLRLICNFAYQKKYKLLKLVKRITGN